MARLQRGGPEVERLVAPLRLETQQDVDDITEFLQYDAAVVAVKSNAACSRRRTEPQEEDDSDDDIPLASRRRQSGNTKTAPKKRASLPASSFGLPSAAASVPARRQTESNIIDLRDSDDDDAYVPQTKKAQTACSSLVTGQANSSSRQTQDAADQFLATAKMHGSLPLCPVIVKHENGTWVELQCPECHGNMSPHLNDFIKGPKGFLTHIKKSHDYPVHGWKETIAHCTLREVPIDEVKKILKGKKKDMPFVKMIPVESETNVLAKQKKERTQTASDWAFVKNPVNYISHISCILRHPDGHYVEIACLGCGGNFVPGKGKYLAYGLKGFWDHMAHSHDPLHGRMPGGPRKIIEACKVRDVSDEEVEKMKKGQLCPSPKNIFSTVKPGKKADVLKKRSREEMENAGEDDEEKVEDTFEVYVERVKEAAEKKAAEVAAREEQDLAEEDEEETRGAEGDEIDLTGEDDGEEGGGAEWFFAGL